MTELQKAEREAGLQKEDVQSVATKIFKQDLTDKQVIEALEMYPFEQEQDPTGNWTEIMEQTLYMIGLDK